MIDWNYCPLCGTRLNREGSGSDFHVCCEQCGFIKYDNPLPTTIGLVIRGDDVLLLRRSVSPSEGKWDTVGGFLSGDETAEQCLLREGLEEIGVTLSIEGVLGTFSSVYGSTGLRTIGIAFTCSIGEQIEITLSPENSEYKWFHLEELPEIAFADVRKALELLASNTN